MPLTGEEARQYRERRRQARAAMSVSGNEIGEAILAGKMRVKDLDPNMSTYYLFWVEDYVTQGGQGTVPDRSQEHLGRVDVGVILMRKVWQRELAALAAGRPLKQWTTPPSSLAEMSAQ